MHFQIVGTTRARFIGKSREDSVVDSLLTLLRIHLMIILWVFCFFGFVALLAFSIYTLLHYLYLGEQWVLKRMHR
jgi:hypothetical protein